MKSCVFVSLLLALGCVWAAPVEHDGLKPASCSDAAVMAAARQALDKINKDRTEGYIYSLHGLSNAHIMQHGENSNVFYLTINVVETNCSVLSKKDFNDCEVRDTSDTPFYGQCKVAIFISRVHRVVRLYKYNCVVRPVSGLEIVQICPDCPGHMPKDDEEIKKTVTLTLDKFNNESGLANYFALLKVTRASASLGMGRFYNAEYTIQETTCAKSSEKQDNCPLMDCEFAHKGFCKGSHSHSIMGDEYVSVNCEIYEPEAAEREKKLHLLGGETDHSHNDTHAHNPKHDGAHGADHEHSHDHAHDHTKSHDHHDKAHKHNDDSAHHHTHDHHGGSAHRHAHDHSHDHGHGHDHVHAHHAKAHNHSGDFPNQHHKYDHGDNIHTHEHDHEIALDHNHKHGHLHEHEHHHHHHGHDHEKGEHDHPKGMWRELPPLGQAVTLPAFPDVPAAGPEVGVTLPLKPDPQIPGQTEPTIIPFPTAVSAECPPLLGATLLDRMFKEDPEFKPAA